MPSLQETPLSPVGWATLGGLGLGAGALLVSVPWVCLGVAGLFGVACLAGRSQLRRLHASRPEGSICSFARTFDRRTTDPWVIRAAWDEVQSYVSLNDRPLPLFPDDDLDRDLGIDPEEAEDVATRVAQRAGYDWETTRFNPFHGAPLTVGTLVQFVNAQPRLVT